MTIFFEKKILIRPTILSPVAIFFIMIRQI